MTTRKENSSEEKNQVLSIANALWVKHLYAFLMASTPILAIIAVKFHVFGITTDQVVDFSRSSALWISRILTFVVFFLCIKHYAHDRANSSNNSDAENASDGTNYLAIGIVLAIGIAITCFVR